MMPHDDDISTQALFLFKGKELLHVLCLDMYLFGIKKYVKK